MIIFSYSCYIVELCMLSLLLALETLVIIIRIEESVCHATFYSCEIC